MILENKSVKHTLFKAGSVIETAESGYHLQSINDALLSLHEKYKEECMAQVKKYFGPGTAYEAELGKIRDIANKKPEEQTGEDREKVKEFEVFREKTFVDYNSDPETIKLVSIWTGENGESVELFNSDLALTAKSVNTSLLAPQQIIEFFQRQIFDIMRKSGLKLAALALKFDDDPTLQKNNFIMVYGSAFRDITDVDINVMDGSIMQLHDETIPDMRKKLGIKEEPQIIT